MKKKIVNFFLMAVMFTAVVGTTVSCKDYDEDMYSDMQGQLNAQTTALQAALATLQAQQEALQTQQNALQAQQDAQGTQIDGLSNALTAAEQTLTSTITAIQASIATIDGQIAGLQGDVAGLQGDVAEIQNELEAYDIAGMWSVYNQLIQYAGDADNYVAMQDALMDFIKEYQNCGSSITQIVEDVATAKSVAEANTTLIENLGDSVSSLKDELAQQKADAEEAYSEIWTVINELLDGNRSSDTDYSEVIEKITTALEGYETRISTLEKTLSGQALQLNNLESCLNQLVTSIVIQGSDNPVFGTLSLPVGIQSNVLAAYYGTSEYDFTFPTARQAYYVSEEDAFLTEQDIEMLGLSNQGEEIAGTLLLGQGNAGTLYLTVNPNTVDYTGVNFTLENSLGEASGVTLDGLVPSNKKLGFGYTRSTDNGFYETTATVTEGDLANVTPRVSISDLKGVISDVKNYVTSKGSSGLNVTSLLSTLYTNCTDVLDANGVCASWTDANGVSHKTLSNYNIAATAIHPLSYEFMREANYSNFPGLGTLENYINKLFNKVQSMIPTVDIDSYTFSKIDSIELKEDGSVKTTVIVKIEEGEVFNDTILVYDTDGNVVGSATVINGYVEIPVDLTEFLEQEYGEINGVIDEINSYLDSVNDILSELEAINDISTSLDDLESKIMSYIDKINNKLMSYLNNANKLVQPIVLVNTTDGYKQLSQIQLKPTLLSSGNDIVLIPTSFTAEILAPAYKKVVGVTNVYSASDVNISAQGGDSGCLSALNAANGSDGIAEVLDGNTRYVTLSNLKAGYIYEIVYTAVDYQSKVVAEKYYVEVAN
ncbi:MAG: hypothetical protein LUC91_02760 [Prevotella sp.]|nr:hypothetical protein [Prevotella sp.]